MVSNFNPVYVNIITMMMFVRTPSYKVTQLALMESYRYPVED